VILVPSQPFFISFFSTVAPSLFEGVFRTYWKRFWVVSGIRTACDGGSAIMLMITTFCTYPEQTRASFQKNGGEGTHIILGLFNN